MTTRTKHKVTFGELVQPGQRLADGKYQPMGWPWSCSCGVSELGCPSPEVARANAAAHPESWRGRAQARWVKASKVHESTLAGASGLRRAVLELHCPTRFVPDGDVQCDGCDCETDYGDMAWPCRTYVLARDFVE